MGSRGWADGGAATFGRIRRPLRPASPWILPSVRGARCYSQAYTWRDKAVCPIPRQENSFLRSTACWIPLCPRQRHSGYAIGTMSRTTLLLSSSSTRLPSRRHSSITVGCDGGFTVRWASTGRRALGACASFICRLGHGILAAGTAMI
jgi:hypothetical protein